MPRMHKIKDNFLEKVERLYYGYSSLDIWNLDTTIAKFILPRLIAFRKHPKGYPHRAKGLQQWEKIIDEMIFAFDYYANHSGEIVDEKTSIRIGRGMDLFAEYFYDLWI